MSTFQIQDQHVGTIEFGYTRAGGIVELVSAQFTTKGGQVVTGDATLANQIVITHYEAITASLNDIGLLHKPSYRKVLGR